MSKKLSKSLRTMTFLVFNNNNQSTFKKWIESRLAFVDNKDEWTFKETIKNKYGDSEDTRKVFIALC
jgi:hypothetical protein